MLVISIPSADLCLHQKIEENVNGRAMFVIVVVERWTFFIAFTIYKMFWPRISLKKGRFGPGFQRPKRSIFWKENQSIFDQFSLSLFSTRTFLSEELAILKSGFFVI